MAKEDLVAQLNTVLDNFVFGTALRCCFPQDLWQRLSNEKLKFEHGSFAVADVELRPLVNRMSNPTEMQSLFDEYEKSLKRSLLSEGHELILLYCEDTNQFPIYKAQPWFQFARIIRHIVSHKDGGILRRWPPDQGMKMATWRTRTLDPSMVGQPVDFLPYEALQLFQDQLDFVRSDLLH
jgi:hypothetical protein